LLLPFLLGLPGFFRSFMLLETLPPPGIGSFMRTLALLLEELLAAFRTTSGLVRGFSICVARHFWIIMLSFRPLCVLLLLGCGLLFLGCCMLLLLSCCVLLLGCRLLLLRCGLLLVLGCGLLLLLGFCCTPDRLVAPPFVELMFCRILSTSTTG